jgi:hypothetical protein
MMESAMLFLKTSGKPLLDPEWAPWGMGIPSHMGNVWEQPRVDASPEQQAFTERLVIIRDTLEQGVERPALAYTVRQKSCVPQDTILLNLLFYLSAEGFPMTLKVACCNGEYAIGLIAQ